MSVRYISDKVGRRETAEKEIMSEVTEMTKAGWKWVSLEQHHHLSSIIPQRPFNFKYSVGIKAPVVPHSEEFFQLSIM